MSAPPLLYALPGSEHLAGLVCQEMKAAAGAVEVRRFPDGESYVRFDTDPRQRDVVLLACLNDPDTKLIPLLLAARTASELGAASVGLITPYMPYLRQDTAFQPGESVSARHIAAVLSDAVDWLVTLDPHLHRLASLSDVFSIPSDAASASSAIAQWVAANVANPVICGPDSESEQWVAAVATACNAPSVVFEKTRHDAHDVDIALPGDLSLAGHTPVILDDIAATGGTLIALASGLKKHNMPRPICCIIHALFSDKAQDRMMKAGIRQIVTTNSIRHPTNAIDISKPLAESAKEMLAAISARRRA